MAGKELFEGAGGGSDTNARFRDIQVLLGRCRHILQERITARDQFIAENPKKRPPKMPVFNAEIVRLAMRKSKQRGKQKRRNNAPKDNNHNDSIVRRGDPQDAPPSDASPDANAQGTDSSE